ncbi:MAG: MXAN_6640 family putative metalloprotease [bacterium]
MKNIRGGKYLNIGICITVLCLCVVLKAAYAHDSLDRAYKRGTISAEAYVVQKLKSYFTPDTVKPSLKKILKTDNKKPTRNITHLLQYARTHFDSFSEESQTYLMRYFARPTDENNYDTDFGVWYLPDPNYWDPSVSEYPHIGGKFRFWYVDHATEDGGGNLHTTTLTYVKSVASVLDTVYNVEINTMGYPAPPDDNNKDDNGGDEKFDVYIMDCGAVGFFGYVSSVGKATDATSGDEANSYYSFMVLDNDFSSTQFPESTPTGALKVTAAHEYHHAIQFGININSSLWYGEITSTWMEDQVFDDVDDNREFLADFFNSPEVSLDYEGDDYHYYGAWIWNEFIETNWGQNTIKLIWDELDPYGSDSAIVAIDTVLAGKGSTLQEAFTEFAAKNYSKTGFYKDASQTNYYIAVNIANSAVHELTPNSTISQQTVSVDHCASKYFKFIPGAAITASSYAYEEYYFNLDTNENTGTVTIDDFFSGTVCEVVLALVNYSKTGSNDDLEIVYSATLTSGALAITVDGVDGKDLDAVAISKMRNEPGDEESGGCFITSTCLTMGN